MTLTISSVNADVTVKQELEINHLLAFVESTACEINRNGKIYGGSKALSHIQKKYDYFKDEIKTTEQFIELSATKSMMSGEFYTVKCNDTKPITTREWLLIELRNYRGYGNTEPVTVQRSKFHGVQIAC